MYVLNKKVVWSHEGIIFLDLPVEYKSILLTVFCFAYELWNLITRLDDNIRRMVKKKKKKNGGIIYSLPQKVCRVGEEGYCGLVS